LALDSAVDFTKVEAGQRASTSASRGSLLVDLTNLEVDQRVSSTASHSGPFVTAPDVCREWLVGMAVSLKTGIFYVIRWENFDPRYITAPSENEKTVDIGKE
jgi:hypothetical protein